MRVTGSVSSTGRQAFLKMNWKCLLVGLVLVFPGTFVSVEGRFYSHESSAVNGEEGLLSNLFKLFQQQQQQQRQLENYYSQSGEPAPAAQKKLGNNNSNNNNNNNHQEAGNNVVQTFDEAAGANGNGADSNADAAAPPAKEPAGGTTSQKENSGGREINKAAQPPQPQRQQASNGSGAGASSSAPFITVVAACTVLAAIGIVAAGVFWYKYNRSAKAASVVDYPAYGVTGPTKDRIPSPGDRKLAHSAQMYHYQHQKQQMMALQGASSGEMKHDGSDDESVEDNDDADYTVYECPGLAPTGEMEVKNPLFRGDETPSTPANDDTRPTPPEY